MRNLFSKKTKLENSPADEAERLLAELTDLRAAIEETARSLATAQNAEAIARERLGDLEASAALTRYIQGGPEPELDSTVSAALRAARDRREGLELRQTALQKRHAEKLDALRDLAPALEQSGAEILQVHELKWLAEYRAAALALRTIIAGRWALSEATGTAVPMALLQITVWDPMEPTRDLVDMHSGWRGNPAAEALFATVTEQMRPIDRSLELLKKIGEATSAK